MHSLADLNYVSSQLISVNDSRTATVIFDKDKPFVLSDVNFESNVAGDLSVNIIPPVNILEIANYSVANTQFVIKDVKRTVNSFTSSVTIPTLPAYMSSASSTTTSGAYTITTYTISGFRSKSDWDVAKNLVWNLASGREANAIWYLDLSIRYYEEALNQVLSVDWSEYDKDHYYQVEMLASSSLSSSGDKRNVINVSAINSIATSYVSLEMYPSLFIFPIESMFSDTIIIDDYDFISATLSTDTTIYGDLSVNVYVISTIDSIIDLSTTFVSKSIIISTIDSSFNDSIYVGKRGITITGTIDSISTVNFDGNVITPVQLNSTIDSISTVAADMTVFSSFRFTLNAVRVGTVADPNVVMYFTGTDVNIDWGDGNTSYYPVLTTSEVSPSLTYTQGMTGTKIYHNYSTIGSRNISITGTSLDFIYASSGHVLNVNGSGAGVLDTAGRITAVTSFGSGYNTSSIRIYSNSVDFAVPGGLPSTLTSIKIGGSAFIGTGVSTWDVSNLTTFENMFSNRANGSHAFNTSVGSWNVTPGKSHQAMFDGCSSFNHGFANWYIDGRSNVRGMFSGCSSFNQSLSNWFQNGSETSLFSLSAMFMGCTAFNQSLNNWKVGRCNDMSQMFVACTNFNQPLNLWDTSNVTNMLLMFSSSGFNQNISTWNVGNVTNMSAMFYYSTAFNQPLDTWNVSNVTDMSGMFTANTVFNQPLNSWNVQKVTTMQSMFSTCSSFNQPLNNWWTKSTTNMAYMFNGCSVFDQNLSSWDVHLIATKPTGFDTSTPATWTTAEKPVWGTTGAH